MAEREPLAEKTIDYTGYFDSQEVNLLIDRITRERGYEKHDLNHDEQHLPEGKQAWMIKEPYKNLTHYAKMVLQVELRMDHVKPVTVNGHKAEEGHIHIVIKPHLHMDWQAKWISKPSFYFLARFMDKYLYKSYTNLLIKGAMEDMEIMYEQLNRFLNNR